ncbi:trimeric intracellular cation channel family protein [Flagellimonas allohymeniacidonis]|uniref:Trimeric intracellular cation channel family protein n=1 Tax=Flagellimonas allohymeniacidonis TaxID=2517819 RepID=A0A4Q8QD16_9FLAO|nr:trimeric intracellular cation channel family protein [Allomuricauda hymeniacidonis]TAI48275.1 trimeric intracellular cation channel family protein [Allomuricauda hymeniacidonis]
MLYQLTDILGTVAFAISGVLVAMDKRLDLFGVLIIAFVTAIGGGTLRDLLIGNTPVTWIQDLTYIMVIPITVVLAIAFANQLKYLRKSLFLFDTLGIGLYTMVGIEKGLEAQLSPLVCIALGTMTASFGGVLRDILCNEIPVIFRKEIYATACILGGALYFLLLTFKMPESYAYLSAILLVILLRILAVRFKIRLPNIYRARD